jgi:hypothetical protein
LTVVTWFRWNAVQVSKGLDHGSRQAGQFLPFFQRDRFTLHGSNLLELMPYAGSGPLSPFPL